MDLVEKYLREETDNIYDDIMKHLKDGGAVMIRTAYKNFGPYLKKHESMFFRDPKNQGVWIQHGKKKMFALRSTIAFGRMK